MASYLRNRRILKVSIIPDDDTLGRCYYMRWQWMKSEEGWLEFANDDRHRRRRETYIVCAFGGPIAEKLLTGRANWLGAHQDIMDVDNLLAHGWYADDDEANAYSRWLWFQTRGLLSQPHNWAGIQALAVTLLDRKEIGGRTATGIIRDGIKSNLDQQ